MPYAIKHRSSGNYVIDKPDFEGVRYTQQRAYARHFRTYAAAFNACNQNEMVVEL